MTFSTKHDTGSHFTINTTQRIDSKSSYIVNKVSMEVCSVLEFNVEHLIHVENYSSIRIVKKKTSGVCIIYHKVITVAINITPTLR